VIAAAFGAGTGAAAGDGKTIGGLADDTNDLIGTENTVESLRDGNAINYLRGVGALVGVAVGVAVGSYATYYRRRY
jgi:hypothetical protein